VHSSAFLLPTIPHQLSSLLLSSSSSRSGSARDELVSPFSPQISSHLLHCLPGSCLPTGS
jgi:hypothetical protein